MIRKLLLSTATAGLLTGGAFAQTMTSYTPDMSRDVLASNVMGMNVYATKDSVDATKPMTKDATANYDDIGTIDDIVMTPSGEVRALVIGVGGFLGMGEKEIAIETSSVNFVPEAENAGNRILIVNADKAQIEAMPEYKAGAMPTGTGTTDKAAATNTTAKTSAIDRPMLKPSTMTHDGYSTAAMTDISTDKLDGAAVYGPSNEDIGKVQGLVLGNDGKSVDKVLLDIGGFLGMGEHEIALSPQEVQIMRADGGSDLRVYVNATKSELEAQPQYSN